MNDPTGYAVLTADGYFVGIWRDREVAQKVLDRSPMAKGERIVEYVPAAALRAKDEEIARLTFILGETLTSNVVGRMQAAEQRAARLETALREARRYIWWPDQGALLERIDALLGDKP